MSDLHLPAINPATQTSRITKFIRTTFSTAKKTTAVIGLSGGVDSATALALTTKALGPKHIHVYLLPSIESGESTVGDAARVADQLRIPDTNIHEINLSLIQQAFTQTLHLYTSPGRNTPGLPSEALAKQGNVSMSKPISPPRLGNITARIRMTLLYDQAKALNALVIGTENRSEHLLGYFTLHGDQASDLEPLIHLYKTQVYALASHLALPSKIITKAPTAGLWADQTDESELGFSYLQADPILHQHFDQHNSAEDLAAQGFDPKLVLQVLTRAEQNRFKHSLPSHL